MMKPVIEELDKLNQLKQGTGGTVSHSCQMVYFTKQVLYSDNNKNKIQITRFNSITVIGVCIGGK